MDTNVSTVARTTSRVGARDTLPDRQAQSARAPPGHDELPASARAGQSSGPESPR